MFNPYDEEKFTVEELLRLGGLVVQKIKRTKSPENRKKYITILQKIGTQRPLGED